uniref:Uncharacterized protein n=1 Tax=Cannabis sativa TaxID=3483 RepID=A0A803Q656_CANSA
MIKDWLGWKVSTQTLPRLLRWIERSKYSKFKKNTLSAVVASLVYLIWKARNEKIWNGKDEDVNRVSCTVKEMVKHRNSIWPKQVEAKDLEWFRNL